MIFLDRNYLFFKFLAPHIGHSDDLNIKISGDKNNININTLEPNLLKYNNIDLFNKIFKKNHKSNISLLNYMLNNKVECALKIFEYNGTVEYPEYIKEAVNECK